MTTPHASTVNRPSYLARETLRVARLLTSDPSAGLRRVALGVGFARAALLFRHCECGALVHAEGYVRVVAEGAIRLGARVHLTTGMIPTELVCREGGVLVIGERSVVAWGASIEATRSVRIGRGAMIASMVRIRDHGENCSAPVVIGDDVWLARAAIIEPGVTIGDGAVVSAGSVVLDDVPPRSLAAGNPARSVPLDRIVATGR